MDSLVLSFKILFITVWLLNFQK